MSNFKRKRAAKDAIVPKKERKIESFSVMLVPHDDPARPVFASRSALTRASPVFSRMLDSTEKWTEADLSRVAIVDLKDEPLSTRAGLEAFVAHASGDDCELDGSNVLSFLHLAEKYDSHDAIERATKYLAENLVADQAIDLACVAEHFGTIAPSSVGSRMLRRCLIEVEKNPTIALNPALIDVDDPPSADVVESILSSEWLGRAPEIALVRWTAVAIRALLAKNAISDERAAALMGRLHFDRLEKADVDEARSLAVIAPALDIEAALATVRPNPPRKRRHAPKCGLFDGATLLCINKYGYAQSMGLVAFTGDDGVARLVGCSGRHGDVTHKVWNAETWKSERVLSRFRLDDTPEFYLDNSVQLIECVSCVTYRSDGLTRIVVSSPRSPSHDIQTFKTFKTGHTDVTAEATIDIAGIRRLGTERVAFFATFSDKNGVAHAAFVCKHADPVTILNLETRTIIASIQPRSVVYSVCVVMHDERDYLVCGEDTRVEVFDMLDSKLVKVMRSPNCVLHLTSFVGADGKKYVVAGDHEGVIMIQNFDDVSLGVTLRHHECLRSHPWLNRIIGLAVFRGSDGATMIASGRIDGLVEIRRADALETVERTIPTLRNLTGMTTFVDSRGVTYIATGGAGGKIDVMCAEIEPAYDPM